VSLKISEELSGKQHLKGKNQFSNCNVTPQSIWPITKSITKMGGPKATSAIHGSLGPILYPFHKDNIITDCIEDQFRSHDFCNCDRR
jgi:hypothetical protein